MVKKVLNQAAAFHPVIGITGSVKKNSVRELNTMTQMENKQQQTFDFNRAVQVYMRSIMSGSSSVREEMSA
ncbi:hypothetical protein Y1Q_0003441 [Alligator mississippiensis]|uniref:Uncharacterized protein n=1 Tax=Alligator mississippiensis TaxID=8496 RepID=A0A151N5K7_ALLMI|nr:hypothetical protein Y1Q_0003441 [Alligator mississippiensis]